MPSSEYAASSQIAGMRMFKCWLAGTSEAEAVLLPSPTPKMAVRLFAKEHCAAARFNGECFVKLRDGEDVVRFFRLVVKDEEIMLVDEIDPDDMDAE